jgi:hypothetical protein
MLQRAPPVHKSSSCRGYNLSNDFTWRRREDDGDSRAVGIIRRTIQQRLAVGTNVGKRALERALIDKKAPRPDLVALARDESSSAALTRMLAHAPTMAGQLSCPILILSSSKQAKPTSPSAHANRATFGNFVRVVARMTRRRRRDKALKVPMTTVRIGRRWGRFGNWDQCWAFLVLYPFSCCYGKPRDNHWRWKRQNTKRLL